MFEYVKERFSKLPFIHAHSNNFPGHFRMAEALPDGHVDSGDRNHVTRAVAPP